MRVELRQRDGGDARGRAVGAARHDDRAARAEHQARILRAGQEHELLGEDIAGLEIGNDQHIGVARHVRHDAFRRSGVARDGVVEGERPIENAAGNLPAVGHLAERGRLHRRRNFRRHRFDRREDGDLRLPDADGAREIDGVLRDVALGEKIGRDVHRRVADQDELGVERRVDDENVRDAPLGLEPELLAHDRAHHLVRVQRPLHDRMGGAGAHHFDGALGGGVGMRRVLDREPVEREAGGFRRRLNLAARPDQHGFDHAEIARLQRAGERGDIARVDDRRTNRRQVARALRQRREARIFGQGQPASVRRHVHLCSGLRAPETTLSAIAQ